MAVRKGINEDRLRAIYRRQDEPEWGSNYQPAILATPQEAPSISWASILTPKKFDCREVHLLSTPERNAALLGLYNPNVVGLQEQRMLSPEPRHHPLWNYPGIDRTRLPEIKGLIDVAERHGYLDLLGYVKVKGNGTDGEEVPVVFPWIGDLLWAITQSENEIYCINWTVKDTYSDFKKPTLAIRSKASDTRKALGRHEIEKIYYEDIGIRTVQVANQAIDRHVAANLRQLFKSHRHTFKLNENQYVEIVAKYQAALESEVPPSEVILHFVGKNICSREDCIAAFYKSIWDRQLRVDLFKPILISNVLKPEEKDVLDVYADWFRK